MFSDSQIGQYDLVDVFSVRAVNDYGRIVVYPNLGRSEIFVCRAFPICDGSNVSVNFKLKFTVCNFASPTFSCAEEVSGIEYVTNNDISVTAENGYIYIEGVKNMPVYLFSVDGKLLHFAENVNGSYSIPAENGVHLIKIGNTSYKIINF